MSRLWNLLAGGNAPPASDTNQAVAQLADQVVGLLKTQGEADRVAQAERSAKTTEALGWFEDDMVSQVKLARLPTTGPIGYGSSAETIASFKAKAVNGLVYPAMPAETMLAMSLHTIAPLVSGLPVPMSEGVAEKIIYIAFNGLRNADKTFIEATPSQHPEWLATHERAVQYDYDWTDLVTDWKAKYTTAADKLLDAMGEETYRDVVEGLAQGDDEASVLTPEKTQKTLLNALLLARTGDEKGASQMRTLAKALATCASSHLELQHVLSMIALYLMRLAFRSRAALVAFFCGGGWTRVCRSFSRMTVDLPQFSFNDAAIDTLERSLQAWTPSLAAHFMLRLRGAGCVSGYAQGLYAQSIGIRMFSGNMAPVSALLQYKIATGFTLPGILSLYVSDQTMYEVRAMSECFIRYMYTPEERAKVAEIAGISGNTKRLAEGAKNSFWFPVCRLLNSQWCPQLGSTKCVVTTVIFSAATARDESTLDGLQIRRELMSDEVRQEFQQYGLSLRRNVGAQSITTLTGRSDAMNEAMRESQLDAQKRQRAVEDAMNLGGPSHQEPARAHPRTYNFAEL